jgi:hypothetical protein
VSKRPKSGFSANRVSEMICPGKYGGNGPWVFSDNPDRGYIRELMDDLRRAVESRKGFCARTCAFERHSHPNLHLTEITKHLSWPR